MLELIGFGAMLLVGVLLGVVGGGGSILTVPVLVYFFGMSPALATGESLLIVGAAALVGAVGYARQKLIDYKTGALFAVPSFLGVFLARRFVIPAIPEVIGTWGGFVLTRDILIMATFAVVMLLAAVSMLWPERLVEGGATAAAPGIAVVMTPSRLGLIGVEGLIVGMITGFVGAGGGFLIIPALVVLTRMPMKTAVGTSLLIIAAKSLLGYLGEAGRGGGADAALVFSLILVALVGIVLGWWVARLADSRLVKRAFGWLVLVMGAFVLGGQIYAGM